MPLTEPGPYPKEQQTARVWSCPKGDESCSRRAPCKSCLGRRNRRGGLKKQRIARRALGVPDARFAGQNGNEESWGGAFRFECKAGKQVESLTARFLAAEAQSDASKPIGDARPFAFVAMPTGMGSEGIVAIRLSDWRSAVAPYLP